MSFFAFSPLFLYDLLNFECLSRDKASFGNVKKKKLLSARYNIFFVPIWIQLFRVVNCVSSWRIFSPSPFHLYDPNEFLDRIMYTGTRSSFKWCKEHLHRAFSGSGKGGKLCRQRNQHKFIRISIDKVRNLVSSISQDEKKELMRVVKCSGYLTEEFFVLFSLRDTISCTVAWVSILIIFVCIFMSIL